MTPTQEKDVRDRTLRAVQEIIKDLSDRKGLGDEWDAIDLRGQREIRIAWMDLIIKEFS